MITLVLVLSSFLSSSSLKESAVKSRVSFPPSASDIVPVSSETTTTKASDISVIPTAALCLVPKFFGTDTSEASGKIHLAASISDPDITTCSISART